MAKKKPIPKKERELAALRQRVEDIYSGVLHCDVRNELADADQKLYLSADQFEEIIRALQWCLGKQLDGAELPKGNEWTDPFKSLWLGRFSNPEKATEHLYGWGIRA